MSGTAEIAISLATYKAIEAARVSLTESHDDIIRRIFNRGRMRQIQMQRDISRAAPPVQRRRGNISISLFGRDVPVANLKYAYVAALQSLAKHKPSLFEHLAQEGTARRRWAGRSASELFLGSPHLARDHAHAVSPGWFIDTNVSRAQIDARLEKACRIAGYRFGEDILISGG
jgi:hypothetical protein